MIHCCKCLKQLCCSRPVGILLSRYCCSDGFYTLSKRCYSKTHIKGVAKPHQLKSSQVRQQFIDFFVGKHNHSFVRSSPVVLFNDPTLLYVNAGMNQFKPILLGNVDPARNSFVDCTRVANSQKCIRVGGKHNDLDDVGKDGSHHTFFEMLGSWSFGDYFKKEACAMAWELLTGPFGLPADRLYVSYFGGDQSLGLEADLECKNIWRELGLPDGRILPFGIKDNFWMMGEVGPCGSCTEIHFDHVGGRDASTFVNAGLPDVIELWNLVFMQYEKTGDGSLRKLSKQHVDTGMGLERLTAILQGSTSNYDTDLFEPLFTAIHKLGKVDRYCGRMGPTDIGSVDAAYRIVADHARMYTVSIADGVLPSECDEGQILRQIIRRAVMKGKDVLKMPPGAAGNLVHLVAETLGDAHPEVDANKGKITNIVNEEEDRFLKQLGKGSKIFHNMMRKRDATSNIFPGRFILDLRCAHGFPEDLIVGMITAEGLIPDMIEYEKLKVAERFKAIDAFAASRTSKTNLLDANCIDRLKINGIAPTVDDNKYQYHNDGNKYVFDPVDATIKALWHDGQFVDKLECGQMGLVVLDRTNFYSEAGGQVCDTGHLYQEDSDFHVQDVQNLQGYVQHVGKLVKGRLACNRPAKLIIDQDRREACMRSHTATHMLNECLRQIVGDVNPRSFYSSADSVRLDITAKKALKADEIKKIEDTVNAAIRAALPVRRKVLAQAEAVKHAMLKSLPSEVDVQMDQVSVITVGNEFDNIFKSTEACCGTHVKNTCDLRKFTIVRQKTTAQTVKTIKAVTGLEAEKALECIDDMNSQVEKLSRDAKVLSNSCEPVGLDLYKPLSRIEKSFRNLRTEMEGLNLPLLQQNSLEAKIEVEMNRISKLMKKIKSLTDSKVCSELDALTITEDVIVHSIDPVGDPKTALKTAHRCFNDYPSMFFVVDDDETYASCHVPKGYTSESFSAKLWMASATGFLSGIGNSRGKDPKQWYYFMSTDVAEVPTVMKRGILYARENMCKTNKC